MRQTESDRDFYFVRAEACAQGIEDALNAYIKSIDDTTRPLADRLARGEDCYPSDEFPFNSQNFGLMMRRGSVRAEIGFAIETTGLPLQVLTIDSKGWPEQAAAVIEQLRGLRNKLDGGKVESAYFMNAMAENMVALTGPNSEEAQRAVIRLLSYSGSLEGSVLIEDGVNKEISTDTLAVWWNRAVKREMIWNHDAMIFVSKSGNSFIADKVIDK
jgi:hypothetical protein